VHHGYPLEGNLRIALGGMQKQNLGPSAGGTTTYQARGQNTRLVQDQRITGGNQLGQITEEPMTDAALRAIEQQQAAFIAAFGRVARNEVRGQLILER
jgi:hypothetical protein